MIFFCMQKKNVLLIEDKKNKYIKPGKWRNSKEQRKKMTTYKLN